jgi:hypothetical protein
MHRAYALDIVGRLDLLVPPGRSRGSGAGPREQVMDDFGNVFRRGEVTALNVHDWQVLSKGAAAAAFLFLDNPR